MIKLLLNQNARLLLLLFLLGMVSTSMLAQEISGQVTSNEGALPGVSVVVKGTTTGTITDAEGNYKLNVGPNATSLVFSFIGMKTQEAEIGSRSVINILMQEDAFALSEVVVTGYSSESKKIVSGSIDVLDTKKAFAIPTTSAAEGFQGRLTGVTVTNDGAPGNAPIVRVRGIATTGNNDPLYIVDGFQTNDPGFLTDLNTNDIKSVTVLKDAAVASIYGARASNGVIVIKTRKGNYDKSGKPRITFDISSGVQTPVQTPDMLNSAQLGEVFWQSMRNDGSSLGDDDFSHPQFGNGATPVLSDFYRGDPALPYNESTNILTKTSTGTDWFDELYDNATYQNYYISVNGGTKSSKYMMSLGYLEKEGVLTGTGYDRYTARANTEFSIKEKLRIGQNLALSHSEQTLFPGQNGDGSPIALAYRSSPLIPVFDEGENFAGTFRSSAGLGNAENPVAVMTRGANNLSSTIRVYGDAYAEVDILEGLTARTNIGVNYQAGTGDVFNPLNPEHGEAITTNSLSTGRFINSGYVWTNTLNYEKAIASDHNLSVILGTEALKQHNEFTLVQQLDFLLNDVPDHRLLGAGVGAVAVLNSSNTTSTLSSYFGKVGYNYQGKYLFSATVRRDKTSRFLEGNNTGVFPAFSVGWILSEEDFLPEIFSSLKIRGSYGQLGNQSLPNATPVVNVNVTSDQLAFYNFGGNNSPGAILQAPGNANLVWETSVQQNLGLDMSLLEGDLDFTFDYFDIQSKDNLIAPDVPSTAPFAPQNPFKNIGEISNRGVDFSITYGNKKSTSDFKYTVGLKVSKYTNEIIETDGKGTSIVGNNLRGITFTNSEVGGPISSFYGREVIGIFRNEAEVADAPSQGFATPADGVGRLRYRDVSGPDGTPDGVIDDLDRITIGSPNPDFTFGLNVDLEYKGFDLALFFSGSQGNEIYNYTKIFTDFPTFYNGNRSTNVLDAFSAENPNGSVPALSKNITNEETQTNSYFVEDGSFIRLKTFQLGYTLPRAMTSKVGMSRARVYLQATNLFTITDYSGLDPEIGRLNNSDIDTGIDFGSYPTSQTYLVGLSVDF